MKVYKYISKTTAIYVHQLTVKITAVVLVTATFVINIF